jgi:hypothetical protein
MPTQPRTQKPFSDGLFDKIRAFNPELELEEARRMLRHKDHVAAGLRGVITKLYRQINKN